MIEEPTQNKMITKPVTAKVEVMAEPVLFEYHFGGSGEFIPQAIKASSIQEATAEWLKTRKPVNKS
jgi:hypothetical protein